MDDSQATGEDTAPSAIIEVGQASRSRSSGPSLGQAMAFLALAAVLVLQVIILQGLGTSNDDLEATRAALTELQVDVRGIDVQVDDVAEAVDTLRTGALSGDAGAAQSNAISVAPGSLPPFTDPRSDLAVLNEYVLGDLSAVEYYTDAEATISPSDGTARVWLVWAHWCPYCQQELPELAAWWPTNAGRFPNTELVTVTTSMDETRGNPLTPYLDSSQFPFPVLVDPDLRLATQFGTSAFPFWIVTDGNGQVVLRVAGAIGIEAVESIFTQVNELAAT